MGDRGPLALKGPFSPNSHFFAAVGFVPHYISLRISVHSTHSHFGAVSSMCFFLQDSGATGMFVIGVLMGEVRCEGHGQHGHFFAEIFLRLLTSVVRVKVRVRKTISLTR